MKKIIIILILINISNISAQIPPYKIKNSPNKPSLIAQESVGKTAPNRAYIIDLDKKKDDIKNRYKKTLDTLNNVFQGKTIVNSKKKEQLYESKKELLTSVRAKDYLQNSKKMQDLKNKN